MTSSQRALVALAALASPALVVAGLAVDASARRARSRAGDHAVATLALRLPSNDLALSGGSRWLRALSLEEPQAAFADGPATPDPDPAGAAVAPPVEVWLRTEAR
jgi:hypothetical protein